MSKIEVVESKIESYMSAFRGWMDHKDCETKTERLKDLSKKIEELNTELKHLKHVSAAV